MESADRAAYDGYNEHPTKCASCKSAGWPKVSGFPRLDSTRALASSYLRSLFARARLRRRRPRRGDVARPGGSSPPTPRHLPGDPPRSEADGDEDLPGGAVARTVIRLADIVGRAAGCVDLAEQRSRAASSASNVTTRRIGHVVLLLEVVWTGSMADQTEPGKSRRTHRPVRNAPTSGLVVEVVKLGHARADHGRQREWRQTLFRMRQPSRISLGSSQSSA